MSLRYFTDEKKARDAYEIFCGLQQYSNNTESRSVNNKTNSKGTTNSKASNSKGTTNSKASNSKGTNWTGNNINNGRTTTVDGRYPWSGPQCQTGDNINNGGAPTVTGRYPWSGPPCQTRVYNTTPIVPEQGRTINGQTRVYNTTPIVPELGRTTPTIPPLVPPPPNDPATPAVLEALDRIEKEVWSHLDGITKLESVQVAEALDKELDILKVGPSGTKSRQQRRKILNALDWIIRTMD